MIYADDDYYKTTYLLGRKPVISAGFTFYARQASVVIDQHTFYRLQGLTEVPEAVRMCCCELAECLMQDDKQTREAGGKTSEKVGTYSVTYADTTTAIRDVHTKYGVIIRKWLADTGLCYQGVR